MGFGGSPPGKGDGAAAGRCHLSGGPGETLVKPVAWGGPQLGDLMSGHLISGGRVEMSSTRLAPCGFGVQNGGC